MSASKPHSERVREALDYALLRVGRELGYYDDILMYRGGKEALDSLVEQLETQQAALSVFLSHPVDNKAIERLRAAVSIPASEPSEDRDLEYDAPPWGPGPTSNQESSPP